MSVDPKTSYCGDFEPTTLAPTTIPDCLDNPLGWYNINETQYNCEWYDQGDNCERCGDDLKMTEK